MCRDRVTVSREDVAQAYEAYYGERVDCKIIMWPKEEKHTVLHNIWPRIRNSDQEFDHYARLQVSSSLASVGGHVKPIGHNTVGNDNLEKAIFSLRANEVSEVLDSTEGLVVVKCLKRIPPDTSGSYEQRRPLLEKEVLDKKVALEITKVFQQLQKEAHPRNFLEARDAVRDAQETLSEGMPATKPATAPVPVPSPSLSHLRQVPGAWSTSLARPVLNARGGSSNFSG